ncbi:MAG: hypothetical protein ACI8PZ_001801 [Myxococcota bacterium]|jgi:hypothetical protein
MARAGTPLDVGDPLPTLQLNTVAHGHLSLPDAFIERRGLVLVYRAHW